MKISPSFSTIQPLAQLLKAQAEVSSDTRSKNSGAQGAQTSEIAKLRARDREVRAHEQAHAAAAGGLARGGPTFTYERGPDGKQYAVGGEVNIDTSPVAGDPEATIRKARQIRAAALAPADPSSQDRAVAASATAIETKARQEIQKAQREESLEQPEGHSPPVNPVIDLFV